jgi:hypothetical protein
LADESKAIAQHQLSEYIQGFKQGSMNVTVFFSLVLICFKHFLCAVPIPTYFIAGPDEDRYLPGSREELCPNLFYLGEFFFLSTRVIFFFFCLLICHKNNKANLELQH